MHVNYVKAFATVLKKYVGSIFLEPTNDDDTLLLSFERGVIQRNYHLEVDEAGIIKAQDSDLSEVLTVAVEKKTFKAVVSRRGITRDIYNFDTLITSCLNDKDYSEPDDMASSCHEIDSSCHQIETIDYAEDKHMTPNVTKAICNISTAIVCNNILEKHKYILLAVCNLNDEIIEMMKDNELYQHYIDKQNHIDGDDDNNDIVNHPAHYTSGKYECIDFIFDCGANNSFCLGNAIKYLSRLGLKDNDNVIQDIQKAIWYLKKEASI